MGTFAEASRTPEPVDVPTCLLETNVRLVHSRLNQKASVVRKQRKKWGRLKLGSIYSLPWFYKNQKVPVMTMGAMGSGIDRTDVNELSFYMEMMKVEARKRRM